MSLFDRPDFNSIDLVTSVLGADENVSILHESKRIMGETNIAWRVFLPDRNLYAESDISLLEALKTVKAMLYY